VRRDTARLSVSYDGPPQFKPIEGTALQYAVNTRTAIIRDHYYACESGVWFMANAPSGPWTVATRVPSSIYTIPVSSPVNYVTNVYVYGSTPEYVYTGYTPGYLGTYLEPDGTVVYGSGYVYPPWIGTVWFGAPITYGLGAAFDWTSTLAGAGPSAGVSAPFGAPGGVRGGAIGGSTGAGRDPGTPSTSIGSTSTTTGTGTVSSTGTASGSGRARSLAHRGVRIPAASPTMGSPASAAAEEASAASTGVARLGAFTAASGEGPAEGSVVATAEGWMTPLERRSAAALL
jgi:hypothetical protein